MVSDDDDDDDDEDGNISGSLPRTGARCVKSYYTILSKKLFHQIV